MIIFGYATVMCQLHSLLHKWIAFYHWCIYFAVYCKQIILPVNISTDLANLSLSYGTSLIGLELSRPCRARVSCNLVVGYCELSCWISTPAFVIAWLHTTPVCSMYEGWNENKIRVLYTETGLRIELIKLSFFLLWLLLLVDKVTQMGLEPFLFQQGTPKSSKANLSPSKTRNHLAISVAF